MSEIFDDEGDDLATVYPIRQREWIVLELYNDTLTPEQAHVLGQSLTLHAQECGYDPEEKEEGEDV